MPVSVVRRVAFRALFLLCACADATPVPRLTEPPGGPDAPVAPRAPVGTWRATALNDNALPALYRTNLVTGASASESSRFVLVDSAEITLHADGQYTQAVYYTEWAGSVNDGPTRPLYREVAVDAGFWEVTEAGALLLDSIWLAGRRLRGTSTTGPPPALRLRHGITVGAPDATFEYRRYPPRANANAIRMGR